ncbi:MAG: hypothetical protein V8Q84_04775 [Bilophila sp.]
MKTMTRLLFLSLALLLAGCLRQEFATTVLSETQPEYGSPQSLIYAIEPLEKRQKRNPRFPALQSRVEKALRERGLRTSRDVSRVTGIIFVDVKTKLRTEKHTYEEPIYEYSSEITGAHGSYNPKTGRYKVRYERTPTYEKKGYRKRSWTSYNYETTLFLQAWDLRTGKSPWTTMLWCSTPLDDEEKVVEAMLEGGKDYIATDTYPTVHLTIEEDSDGGYTASVDE